MTSKCGTNKILAHEIKLSESLMFLPIFDIFFASITGQITAKWNLVVLQFGEQKMADCISQPFLNIAFVQPSFEQSVGVFSLKKSL